MANFNSSDPRGSHEYGNYYNPDTSGGYYDNSGAHNGGTYLTWGFIKYVIIAVVAFWIWGLLFS